MKMSLFIWYYSSKYFTSKAMSRLLLLEFGPFTVVGQLLVNIGNDSWSTCQLIFCWNVIFIDIVKQCAVLPGRCFIYLKALLAHLLNVLGFDFLTGTIFTTLIASTIETSMSAGTLFDGQTVEFC